MYYDPDYYHDYDHDYDYKFQFSIEKSAPQDQKLRIKNIHVSITEEMLWSKFKDYGQLLKLEIARDKTTCKSLEYGFITFKTAQAAKEAIKALNFTFLRSCEDFPNQKRVQIYYDIDLEQYKQIKDKGITLLGIPKQNIDYNHFYNHLTQYGDILLSQLREKDQEYQCYIVFKEQEDLIKFLQFQNNFEYQGHKITVQNLNLFKKSNKKCVYIENFYRDLTDSESQTTESRKMAAETIKTYLIDKISKYGEISYCTVSFDPYTKKKPYAYLSMKFTQNLEHLLQLYNENKQEIISLGFSKNIIINEKK